MEGVVGDVTLGLRREGGSEGAEQRRKEECSQTAHVGRIRQDFWVSKWAVWGGLEVQTVLAKTWRATFTVAAVLTLNAMVVGGAT